MYGANMAWQIRNVFIAAMNDSIQVGTLLIVVVIVCAFEVAISFVVEDPTAQYVMLSSAFIIVSVCAVGLVWGGKFFAIYTGTEERWTTDESRKRMSAPPPNDNNPPRKQESQNSGKKRELLHDEEDIER